jgi:hypothetical protein
MWMTLLLGCRSPEVDAFLLDTTRAICARHALCGTLDDAGYASEADCLVQLDVSLGVAGNDGALSCRAFDNDAAESCLSAWDIACDASPDLSVCEDVCQ